MEGERKEIITEETVSGVRGVLGRVPVVPGVVDSVKLLVGRYITWGERADEELGDLQDASDAHRASRGGEPPIELEEYIVGRDRAGLEGKDEDPLELSGGIFG
jgi:hypothetical protein